MINKNVLMATLVLLSIMQGSVYADTQKRLIGFAQWDGFIEYDFSDGFVKGNQELPVEDNGETKTISVTIDEDLKGYNGAMDQALVFLPIFDKNNYDINFLVDNGGKGLTFLYDKDADDSNEVYAMLDASVGTGGNKINVSIDLGGDSLNANQGTTAVVRIRGNAHTGLTVSNGSLNLYVDEADAFNDFEAAISLDGTSTEKEESYFKATDNIKDINIINKSSTIANKDEGLAVLNMSNLYLTAQENLRIIGVDTNDEQSVDFRWGYGIYNAENSVAELNAKKLIIDSGIRAIEADGYGSIVRISAQEAELNGGVSAYNGAIVNFNGNSNQSNNETITLVSQNLGNSTGNDASTVYVQGDKTGVPEVNVTGNQINILSNNKSVWASGDGGTVNITGTVNINAKYTGTDGASMLADEEGQHIAIVAGVAGADSIDTNHGEVNVKLQGTDDSYITGDIVAARDGIVNITHEDYAGKLHITGDILAGNGRVDSNDQQLGVVNVDLGKGGYLEGRADDYQDANLKADSTYFDPHFTDGKVDADGEVNITMGEDSVWNVTGQSWVTNLKGDKSTIILCGKDTSGNIKGTGGYSIHIGALEGENTFVVNLNPEDVAGSDMIYIQDGTSAKQTLVVNNENELLNLQEGERIRFATIADAEGSFDYGGAYNGAGTFGNTYAVKGRGLRNVELGVQYVDMDKESEVEETYQDVGTESQYNGGSDFTESNDKPGISYVEGTYDKIEEGKTSQNVYLVRNRSITDPGDDDNLTDSGETIINMSHANYKNAVYMDRLNKRLGEVRYIDGDEGMWVRLRHDRIGQQGEFRSLNTMYQLGYDKLDNKDNRGERHIGAAIDYMDGSTSYSDIYGEGETKRWGFWMYDTWLGNKGHYADYIVKFGHLQNEFDLRDKDSGEKVTGDYDNNVFSISAEYGRKKDMGNNWYIEPQVQLQLARVTDAEYATSQGTNVYVDGINSLIGRAGFRLGRDVDEISTIYVKADVLHEFLGDQRIVAGDVTGALDKTYENSGTWYDVGFGFATAVGHNSYAYLDFEKSFGSDNDETYQINAGLQWSF